MKKNIQLWIAQILFAVPFAYFGVSHLMAGSAMGGMVPFPGGTVWVYISGIAQLLAAIAFVINVQVRLAAYLLALYLLIVILAIQMPNTIHHVEGAAMMLVKDIGLLAGAVLLACQHSGTVVVKKETA